MAFHIYYSSIITICITGEEVGFNIPCSPVAPKWGHTVTKKKKKNLRWDLTFIKSYSKFLSWNCRHVLWHLRRWRTFSFSSQFNCDVLSQMFMSFLHNKTYLELVEKSSLNVFMYEKCRHFWGVGPKASLDQGKGPKRCMFAEKNKKLNRLNMQYDAINSLTQRKKSKCHVCKDLYPKTSNVIHIYRNFLVLCRCRFGF